MTQVTRQLCLHQWCEEVGWVKIQSWTKILHADIEPMQEVLYAKSTQTLAQCLRYSRPWTWMMSHLHGGPRLLGWDANLI